MEFRLHGSQSYLYSSVRRCFVPSGRPSGYILFCLSPPYLSGDSTVSYVDRGRATAAVRIDSLGFIADCVGTLGCCWVAPAFWAVCTLYRSTVTGSPVPSVWSPPPEGTLFQVVAQEEVVGSTEPAVSAFAGPLTEGEAIQAVFDQLTAKRPEAGYISCFVFITNVTSV